MKELYRLFVLNLTFITIFAYNASESLNLSDIPKEYSPQKNMSKNTQKLEQDKVISRRQIETKPISKPVLSFDLNPTNFELMNNSIRTFEYDTTRSMGNLRYLNISQIKHLKLSNNTFEDLVSLNYLVINNISFMQLPQGIFHNNENLEVVDFSWNLLEKLPEALFTNNKKLRTVCFRGNWKLTSIPGRLLNDLMHLKSVNFNGCHLENLPEKVFQGSRNLRNIYLNENFLQTLPEYVFYDLRNLVTLQLANNRIETLPNKLFKSCTSLRILYLNNNNIMHISRSIFGRLVSLETLFLQNNRITKLGKKSFSSLQNLTEINLSHNNITNLVLTAPSNKYLSKFKDCKNLRNMDLSFNKIDFLFHDWIKTPPVKFEYLNLSYNAVPYLTDEDFDFHHTQNFTLNLSNNNITAIYLYNVKDLLKSTRRNKVVLDVENNPIKCDCYLTSFLEVMNLAKTQLKENLVIKTGFMNCDSPKEYEGVLLSDLNITDYKCIPPKAAFDYYTLCPNVCDVWFLYFENELFFDCSNRNLTLAPETLCSLKDKLPLSTLDLRGNLIQDIPNFEQFGYHTVTQLLLSQNQISTIPNGIFVHNLRVLHVDNNKIRTVSTDVIRRMHWTLESVKIGNNPWNCDYETRDFFHYIQFNRNLQLIRDIDNVTCESSLMPIKTSAAHYLSPNHTFPLVKVCIGMIPLGLIILMALVVYYYDPDHRR